VSKNILSIGLLLFVAASIVVLVVKSLRQDLPADAWTPPSDGVVAYYFHGKVRCVTCKNIEAFAHEAIQSGFAEQLEKRQIVWRVVNYEQPGNEHFVKDFGLIAPTVILVRMTGGSRTSWTNLDRVWELVDDRGAFVEYVQQQTRGILEGAGDATAGLGAESGAEASKDENSGQDTASSSEGESQEDRPQTNVPSLVDLGAHKCIPCKMMAPILEELREEYRGRLNVVFIDVWENPEAGEQFSIETIPTQIFYDASGQEVFRHVGFFSKEDILRKWGELGLELE
jgi:thioredoxin 1